MLSLPILTIELKIAKCMKKEKYILQYHSNKNKSILIKQSGLPLFMPPMTRENYHM